MTFHPILREKTKRNVELTVQGILVEILREEVWTNHLYLNLLVAFHIKHLPSFANDGNDMHIL